jgi:hypothetical protein
MKAEDRIITAIALVGIDSGKVNEVSDMAIQVFQFVDREASVKHIAAALDGANCYSVSVVDRGQLVPLGKLWLDAARNPGLIKHDWVNSAVAQWIQEVSDMLETEAQGEEVNND